MRAEDSVYAAEQIARRRRGDAVQKLVAAERAHRLLLVSRILLIAAVAVSLPSALFEWNALSVIAASACALVAVFNVTVAGPRSRQLVATRRSGFRHIEREYDAVFARMITFEQGGPEALAERDANGSDRLTFYCPACGGQGHWNGFDPHDIAVPHGHERQIVGDGEVWVVCHEIGTPRRWRYDPYDLPGVGP